MAILKSVQLPKWLDDIIYIMSLARFMNRALKMLSTIQINSLNLYNCILVLIFPRSYAEAYCIMNRLFDNPLYKQIRLVRRELFGDLIHLLSLRILVQENS